VTRFSIPNHTKEDFKLDSYTELYDVKDFQDYMEEKVGQEIDIESSLDPTTKLEKDDKRIVFQPHKKDV
jgi:hypothetical protein